MAEHHFGLDSLDSLDDSSGKPNILALGSALGLVDALAVAED